MIGQLLSSKKCVIQILWKDIRDLSRKLREIRNKKRAVRLIDSRLFDEQHAIFAADLDGKFRKTVLGEDRKL